MDIYVRNFGQRIDRHRFRSLIKESPVAQINSRGFYFFKNKIVSSSDCNLLVNKYLSHAGIKLSSLRQGTSLYVRLPTRLFSQGGSKCLIANIARNNTLVDTACNFLGFDKSELYSAAFVDASPVVPEGRICNPDGRDGAFRFHVDLEAYRFLKMFIYLVDIFEENCGHHEYVSYTCLNYRSPLQARFPKRFTSEEIKKLFPDASIVKQFSGKGFCFAEDTTGFHRGSICSHSPRIMLSIIYGGYELRKAYGKNNIFAV